MAKTTKNNFRPTRRNNYKAVVRMADGGNVSELNYSERKAYIEEHYAPFIKEAQMIFSIYGSDIQYDYKSDRNEVVKMIIEKYQSLGDYTEETLPKETNYEIQDWDLVRRDIDPETDEVIGETSLEEVTADNTYNFSYLGLVDLNWRLYEDKEYDKFFYVIMPHLGGDIRGNYGDAIILEGSDKDELFYRFYEEFISGSASVYLKFKDGSEVFFDSEQDSDVFYFRVSDNSEPTGMAQSYLEDFEKFDSWQGDEFLEETVDVYLMRKGKAPKMMAGGSLDNEVPHAYVQILGYDEGKWIDLSDFSDGDDVMSNIYDWMSELNKELGGNREEYMIADYEGFGRDMYDEYMGKNEFDEILEAYEKYKDSDFPSEVISSFKNDSGNRNSSLADIIDQMDNSYLGQFDNYYDFGYDMVEQGVYSPTESDVYVTDTDKRILAGEEADALVDYMSFDDLIEKADRTREDYEKEKSELEDSISEIRDDIESLTELQNSTDDDDSFDDISEQIEEKELELETLENSLDDIESRYEDDAKEEVRSDLYDEIYDKLENDLGSFLDEYGYSDDLQSVSFLSVDYEKIGEEIASDYLVIDYENSMYFFNNYSKGGRLKATKTKTKYDFYIVENSTKKLVSGYSTKSEAVQQRKLLIEQYPTMRFEIYPLAKLETSTELDVNSKKDYVELSTLDKIKKVSVDAYRYGKEKVNQAQYFLERNDVKGRIKRGARKVVDKTKQGADWLKRQWHEADFGDGKGKAEFFADGGIIDSFVNDMVKNQIARRTIKIKDQEKFIKFMNDIQPYVDKKIVRVKVNPINKEEVWVSLQQFNQYADGGALSNDPTFIPYNGQEIMFVPVYGTFWVDDIEFDTEELAKKYIDKEYGKFADGGGLNYSKLNDDVNWYVERIKSGNMSTTKKDLLESIERHKKDLFLLEVGRIKPKDVIGTGYKGNTRKLAENWLKEQIYKDEKKLDILIKDNFYKDGGGVGYEPITKPVPTTKPQTPTKPDKNNPYKPKAIPRPKATKVNFEM
jgi:hypothetical protein